MGNNVMLSEEKQKEFTEMLGIFTQNIETYISNYLSSVTGTTPGCYYESKWSFDACYSIVIIEVQWFYHTSGYHLDSYRFSIPISFFLKEIGEFYSFVNKAFEDSEQRIKRLEEVNKKIEMLAKEKRLKDEQHNDELKMSYDWHELFELKELQIPYVTNFLSEKKAEYDGSDSAKSVISFIESHYNKLLVRREELEKIINSLEIEHQDLIADIDKQIAELTKERDSLSTGSKPIDGWDVHWIK